MQSAKIEETRKKVCAAAGELESDYGFYQAFGNFLAPYGCNHDSIDAN
jgi:hypothetical protein